MKKTFNSLKIKKTFAFLLVLVCTTSIGGHSVLAKTGTKATNKKTIQAARIISGVLYGEVPSYYCEEALKAQAIAARSYTLYRIYNGISHAGGADICTDYTHCQVKSYSLSDFANAVTNYNSSAVCDNESGTANVKNIKRSPSGRIISAEIGGITFTGLQIRAMFSLRSSNIYFSDVHSGEGSSSVAIVALGYGHGVGMSQCGAQAMALNGADYEEILKHYYTGIELSQITSLQE